MGLRGFAFGRVREPAVQKRGVPGDVGAESRAGKHPLLARFILPLRKRRSSARIDRRRPPRNAVRRLPRLMTAVSSQCAYIKSG